MNNQIVSSKFPSSKQEFFFLTPAGNSYPRYKALLRFNGEVQLGDTTWYSTPLREEDIIQARLDVQTEVERVRAIKSPRSFFAPDPSFGHKNGVAEQIMLCYEVAIPGELVRGEWKTAMPLQLAEFLHQEFGLGKRGEETLLGCFRQHHWYDSPLIFGDEDHSEWYYRRGEDGLVVHHRKYGHHTPAYREDQGGDVRIYLPLENCIKGDDTFDALSKLG